MNGGNAPLPHAEFGGASFSFANRVQRVLWRLTWILLASWTPPNWSPWRILLLKSFGAKVAEGAMIAASAKVWLPRHLELGQKASIGPGVDCYNMAPIVIGARSIVSQRAFLCAGTHDVRSRRFQLAARSIEIGDDVWIAAEAFVGPGVRLHDGCVLGARGCAFSDLKGWTIYRGNPANPVKERAWLD